MSIETDVGGFEGVSAPPPQPPTISGLALLNSALQHAREPDAAPALREFASGLRRRVSQRDHPDIQRSFSLQPATPLGAWFEQLPIEVVPGRPSEPMSSQLATELKNYIVKWPLSVSEIFETLFEERCMETATESDRRHRLWLGFGLLGSDPRPWQRSVLYNRLWPVHPDHAVRSLLLSLAYVDLPWPAAERFLYACTHDTDEPVFIKAFRMCGRRHDERAMDHLRPIVRSPAGILQGLAKGRMYYPVGHAAASVCCAEFAILGTDHPDLAARRQEELYDRLRRPLSEPVERARDRLTAAIAEFRQPSPPQEPPADLADMVEIPAGPFICGLDANELREEWFDWASCHPRRTVTLPRFYIDRQPITNAQYDDWCAQFEAATPEERRRHEHPGQPFGKPHRRNTRGDSRFGPDHPVVGIDWFDAWAYAHSLSKQLPSELQWEKAARGTDGRRYPWGSEFRTKACRYSGQTYEQEPVDLVDWICQLARSTGDFPPTTTAPVNGHPDGASPYGVLDMCGNCWEYTRTAFFTRHDVRPAFSAFTPVELMGSREGHVVIRGGAWSSPAPLIAAPYRGYDLLTDRHSEIGFRCVWVPFSAEEDQDG